MSGEPWKESLWNVEEAHMLQCWRKSQAGRGSCRLNSEGQKVNSAPSKNPKHFPWFPQTHGSLWRLPSIVWCIFAPTSLGHSRVNQSDVFLCIFFRFLGYLFLAFWEEINTGSENTNNIFSGRWISLPVVHFQRSVPHPRNKTSITHPLKGGLAVLLLASWGGKTRSSFHELETEQRGGALASWAIGRQRLL